jgi:hypothetical protein
MDFDYLLPIRAQIGKKSPFRFFGENLPQKQKNNIGSLWKPYHEIEQPTISSLVVNGP